MPKPILPAACAALALCGCGGDQPADPPADPSSDPATSKSAASIMLHGDFSADEGETLEIVQTLSMTEGDLLQTRGENEITGSVAIEQTERQSILILQDGGREIEIGDGGSTVTVRIEDDEPREEKIPDPLAGATILATPRTIPGAETTWSYAFKDDEERKVPAGFGSADLRADGLYPREWLSFGETWEPEPSAIAALLGAGFQLRDGSVKMKLLGVENRDGDRCAVIHADIDAVGVYRSADSRQDVKLRLKGKIYRSRHIHQDVEIRLSGTMELHSEFGGDEVHIKGPVSFSRVAKWNG